jgi:hypothetical protein
MNEAGRTLMKRRLWTIGLVSMALLLASCGRADLKPPEDASAAMESLAEVVSSSEDVRRISPLEASVLVEGGGAVLYDTRSAGSYDNQHAAGAISFPESEASLRIDELPTDKTLIFY